MAPVMTKKSSKNLTSWQWDTRRYMRKLGRLLYRAIFSFTLFIVTVVFKLCHKRRNHHLTYSWKPWLPLGFIFKLKFDFDVELFPIYLGGPLSPKRRKYGNIWKYVFNLMIFFYSSVFANHSNFSRQIVREPLH